MAFYISNLILMVNKKVDKKVDKKNIYYQSYLEENYVGKIRELMQELNGNLGYRCGKGKDFSIYCTDYYDGHITVAISLNAEKTNISECKRFLSIYLKSSYSKEGEAICKVYFTDLRECSAIEFYRMGDRASDQGYISNWRRETDNLGVDFFDNRTFKLDEQLYEGKVYSSLNEAINDSKKIMNSATLNDELTRIFSEENEKKYYGNPIHYRINATNKKSGEEIIHILHKALMKNKRMVSSRIAWLHGINSGCYDEDDIINVFKTSQGGMVVIEVSGTNAEAGNYATSYHDVVDFFYSVISTYHRYTLCVFLEIAGKGGFGNALLSKVQEDIDIIDINEGVGNKDAAKKVLKYIADNDNESMSDKDIEDILGDKKEFSSGEVYAAYDGWYKYQLKNKKYKSYKSCKSMVIETYGKNSDPYKELFEMVGLKEVKQIVNDIIDTANVRKMRKSMGLPCEESSLHMVFTGNPGSAKTTIARMIADILKNEGILRNGTFVECGRADLVGKYVGWTAKAVRAKFREAAGGILFIDEAYSLLDDSNSFGDEAINTIVQEMENRRDDVIVVFAGYPQKMEMFLTSNEGLNSRINYHLEFPDYKPDELCKILEFMMKRKGYKFGEGADEKCLDICKKACKQKDYGNGRFIRNLLEQAEMVQSRRLMTEKKYKAIRKEDLITLMPDDFNVNIERFFKNKTIIGFAD